MTNNQKEEWSWMPHDECRMNPNLTNQPTKSFWRSWFLLVCHILQDMSAETRERLMKAKELFLFFSGEKDWDPTFSAVEELNMFLVGSSQEFWGCKFYSFWRW